MAFAAMGQRLHEIRARFHSGLFEVSGAKRVSGLNTADQNSIAQRWLNGNDSVFSGAFARTGGRLNDTL